MKPNTYAERLAKAYRKIGKECTPEQAQRELDRAWSIAGLSPEYVVASIEHAKFALANNANAPKPSQ